MIVDFVDIKMSLHKRLKYFINREVDELSPISRGIQKHVIYEGKTATYETVDHEGQQVELEKFSSSFSFQHDELPNITMFDIVKKAKKVAIEMARHKEGLLLQTFSKMVRKTGNTVESNKPFDYNIILEGLKNLPIDFDDTRDRPHMPEYILGQSQFESFKKSVEQLTEKEKEEFLQKREQILDEKYQDYLERENKRVLL